MKFTNQDLEIDIPKIKLDIIMKNNMERQEKQLEKKLRERQKQLERKLRERQMEKKFVEEFGEWPKCIEDIPNHQYSILKKADEIVKKTKIFENGVEKNDFSKLTDYDKYVMGIAYEIKKIQIIPIKMICNFCNHEWYYRGQHWKNPDNVIVTCPRCGRKNKLSDGSLTRSEDVVEELKNEIKVFQVAAKDRCDGCNNDRN